MIRKIIHIDEEKCNGCGLCANACHEGAIGMVEGKAKLLRDDYCDGLGDCLPVCPTGAITFVKREAAPYDEKAVAQKMGKGGCPSSVPKTFDQNSPSALRQWPAQIKLAPVTAPYFHHASLLIAADCAAYAYRNFHRDFMENRITLIGCPKLDQIDYSEKLAAILSQNDIERITIARMEVPCCGGLEYAVKEALKKSGKKIPVVTATLSVDGTLLKEESL